MVSQQIAGDHVLFIGEVMHHRHDADEPALAFHAGHYHAVGERL
jgi:flavin reductase (DIM6/NTAB) family NADH-FMN oxidoreductase RutF